MRAKGIDISHWQGLYYPPVGLDFIVVKATEGTATDSEYADNVDRIVEVPIKGTYHYYRTEIDPIDQAEYVWEVVKDDGFDFYALDYEKYNNILDRAGAEGLWECYQYLKLLTDKPIVLYTTEYIFRDNVLVWNEGWIDVELWVARWANVDDPLFLDLGAKWAIWQYGIVEDIDRNVFNGTLEEMMDWIKTKQEPDMNKKWYASKTLWFSILFALVNLAGIFGYAEFVPGDNLVQYVNLGISLVVALLRVFTNQGVEL